MNKVTIKYKLNGVNKEINLKYAYKTEMMREVENSTKVMIEEYGNAFELISIEIKS